MHEHELAKVHVDGYQRTVFRGCVLDQCQVAGVRAEVIGEDGVMTFAAQPNGQASPCTSIDEESHPLATDTAASESPATTAWA